MTYEIVSYIHFWEVVEYAHHYNMCGLTERARIMSHTNDFWFHWEIDELK